MMRTVCLALSGFLLVATSVPSAGCSLPAFNKITVSKESHIRWNGREIDRSTLIKYIQITNVMNPIPRLFVDYHVGANCAVVRNTFRTVVAYSTGGRITFGADDPDPPIGKGCDIPIRYQEATTGLCGTWGYYFLVRPN